MTQKDLSKKIKIALAEAGINQSELAKRLKIKQPQITAWIKGTRNPKNDTLQKIALATGKPLNYFFDNSVSVGGDANHSLVGQNTSANTSAEIEMLKKDNELIKKDVEILKLKIALLEKKK